MALRVEMLGTARVIVDDQNEVRLRSTLRDQALAYLAYSGDWVSRDRLGFLFWADVPDPTARHNVRQLLKRIRHLDWLSGLEVDTDNVRWLVPTDVDDLRAASTEEDPGQLPPTGRLLPGFERGARFEYEEWLLSERQRVLGEWQAALLRAAERAAREGRPDVAARLLESALVEAEDETVLLRYMDFAARAGDPLAAINAYRLVTKRLRSDLGVEPTQEAEALFERLRDADRVDGHDVPPQIVGRIQETNEILGLLTQPSCRLLTLLGPGGIGKSTLAAHVAKVAAPRFANGSTLVSLESLSDPSVIPSVIAAGLGAHLDARIDPVEQIISLLSQRQLLLVVDNVEHLPDGWILLSELVRACPRLNLIVTSRERLRLEDEWVYEVDGLSSEEAAVLLLQRARQVAPGLVVSEVDAISIAAMVGGSPLGIELAVPWLRTLSPREIMDEILGDPSLLRGGSRDTVSRHRSLEAAMTHSWRLLSVREKQAIEALAVFVAPFTRELASDVADVDAALLRDLIDKSLVGQRTEGLYASHPLVRQYAASRIAAAAERRSEVRSRHARAILGLLDPPQRAVAHRGHLDDMIEGWHHAVDLKDDELIGRSVEGFGSVLDATGRITQGLELMARAAARLDDATDETLTVMAGLQVVESMLLQRQGRFRDAVEAAQAAVEAATNADDRRRLVRALVSLAWARKWTEGHGAQQQTLLEALPIARKLDDELLLIDVLRSLGCSAPPLEKCREYLTDALGRADGPDLLVMRCHILSNLGSVVWGLGEISEAMSLHEQQLDLARSHDLRMMATSALVDLAFLHAETSNLDKARELIEQAESLISDTEAASLNLKLYATEVAGEVWRLIGEFDAAQRRVYQGLQLATATGLPPVGLRSLRLHGQLLIDRGQVEEGLGMLALVCSWTHRGPDFTAWILDPRIWAENTKTVDPKLIERAREWTDGQDLAEVVERVLAQTDASSMRTRTGASTP